MDPSPSVTQMEISESPSRIRNVSMIYFKFIRPCLAEFFATMLFVFLDVCSLSPKTIAAGFTHGFTLFVMVAATAGISGGHINPAVTMAITACRGLDLILAPFYILAQILGSIVGAALARAVLPSDWYDVIVGGVHMVNTGVDAGQAILAEMMATCVLVLAVLMIAFDTRNKSVLAPLAIGFAVIAGIFALGGISGGSMNPARSFGPAVVRNSWGKHYVYWVGPFLGSLLSTLIYTLLLATPDRLWVPFQEPLEY